MISLFRGRDDAAVRKVYQDSKGFLWIFTGLPGIIRLDPETGVKQYLNTPSGYMASSPENELFIYEDPNGVVWTIPYKGIFSYYDEKSRDCHSAYQHSGRKCTCKYFFQSHDNTPLSQF